MSADPRRHQPRVSFAGRLAPVLELDGDRCEVVDLSSDGLRFRDPAVSNRLNIGEVLHGVIRFPADRAIEVEARVLRVGGGETALQLSGGHESLASAIPAGPAPRRRSGLLW